MNQFFNIFIFIISPLLGVSFFIIWYIKHRRAKKHKSLLIGFFLILFPIIELIRVNYFSKNNLDLDSIVGTYTITNHNQVILKVNQDRTFELFKNEYIPLYGIGKWDIIHTTIYCLNLDIKGDNTVDMSLDINVINGKIKLNTNSLSRFGTELMKK